MTDIRRVASNIKVRKHILVTSAALILALMSVDTYAAINSMGEAINIAGRQRMLSQRIAQAYLLIGIQTDSARGSTLLKRSTQEFSNNLQALKAFKPAEIIKGDLRRVEQRWLPYRTLAESPVNKENAEALIALSDQLLYSAHAYVGQLEALSGTGKAELINISGRQRMLSQRIAKNFLAIHWEVNTGLSTNALYEDLDEYKNMLNYLTNHNINTARINTQLQKVSTQFEYASRGFDGVMSLSGKRLVNVVTGTTDNMLRGMNIATGLYAELLTE